MRRFIWLRLISTEHGVAGNPINQNFFSEYLDFLCKHRGLCKETIRMRRNDVMSFLQSLRLQDEVADIERLSAKRVYDYIIKTAKLMTLPSRRHLVASIRSFLKFAHLKGYVSADLQRLSRLSVRRN